MKVKQIGLLHTVGFLADMFRNLFQETIPDINSFHIVDEGIIKQLMENNGMTPGIIRRIALQANFLMESGADLILFTCSSTAPAVDTVKKLVDIPIIKVDEPMAEKAVSLGEKIGVITTAKTTLAPSVQLIESTAERLGKKVKVQAELEADAFQARLSGNIQEHDRIVKESIYKLSRDNEVVVLAQASMAHLADEMKDQIEIPVLASPLLCMEALKKMLSAS